MPRAKAKKKTYRSLNVTSSPTKKHIHARELLLTYANGDVLKVETIEKSGKRREVSEAEFAELAGEATADFGEALEHAYTLGLTDALEDELSAEEQSGDGNEEDTIRRLVIMRAAGFRRLRERARKLILARAISARQMQRPKRPKRAATRH